MIELQRLMNPGIHISIIRKSNYESKFYTFYRLIL